ncbi:hypothetical protein BDZ97DRAFT_1929174 [Flammula alnicola]|nr:hypothetical protein BDZ97DRAFT_1929174 [Flammula alnicola]
MLATWKLGGIVAPLDHNVPKDIMERMLPNIGPTFILVPSPERVVQNTVHGISLSCLPFDPKDATITALMQKYLDQSPEIPLLEFLAPTPDDIALYLHTSSSRTWPQQEFANLRVLGWSPWSHIIGLSNDLGAAMLLTAGCYIFAMVPSAYGIFVSGDSNKASRYLDVCGQLLETAMTKKPTAFAGVPWVLEGFMRSHKQEVDAAQSMGIPLVLDIGMTELGGPLFHSTTGGAEGWYSKDCLLADAALNLVDEAGANATSEGELVIKSRLITKGYLQYDNSSFTVEDDGTVSFRTGDIYGYIGDQRLVWKGRKEDYIQMSSGESLDPRIVEAILNQCPAVVRSCVVGNNFLKTSSQVVCAIVRPVRDPSTPLESRLHKIISRAISIANRGLAPPLRISWARVLVLKEGEEVPLTKKGAIFRKKLEQLFGEQLSTLLSRSDEGIAPQTETKPATSSSRAQGKTRDQIAAIVSNIVLQTLRISEETMDDNAQATFAELGMDSAMSTMIVSKLNRQLDMALPLNTCHTHIDLVSLTNAILSDLGTDGTASKIRPSTRVAPPTREREEIVIVGQAVRLPGDIDTPEGFWKALIDKREDIMTPVPASRWDHASFYRSPDSKEPPAPCDITLEKAGFVDVYGFDHSFFGISSAEAFHVAPNIRLFIGNCFRGAGKRQYSFFESQG